MTIYAAETTYGSRVHGRLAANAVTLCGRPVGPTRTSLAFSDIDCSQCLASAEYEKYTQAGLFSGPHLHFEDRPSVRETLGIKADKADVLKAALAPRGPRDPFEVGDVVRWTAAGRYTYAAVKTSVGWYTTASPSNPFVTTKMDYDELLAALSETGVTDVVYASAWTRVV